MIFPCRVLARIYKLGAPKWPILKFLVVQIFQGEPQYTQISTINMYAFIKVRHAIIIQWHRNDMEMKRFNYMLEIDILRNSSQIFLGSRRGAF